MAKKETKEEKKARLQESKKIDRIIEMIIEGKTYRSMAIELGMPLSSLHDLANRVEHSARVKTALDYSASSYDEKGEEVLTEIKATSTQVEMQRARELAQHYRWKASKRSPKRYGERIAVETGDEVLSKIDVPARESREEWLRRQER